MLRYSQLLERVVVVFDFPKEGRLNLTDFLSQHLKNHWLKILFKSKGSYGKPVSQGTTGMCPHTANGGIPPGTGRHARNYERLLTFKFSIRNHLTTSFSTIRGAVAEKVGLFKTQKDFFKYAQAI
jgi:hypothetical protein